MVKCVEKNSATQPPKTSPTWVCLNDILVESNAGISLGGRSLGKPKLRLLGQADLLASEGSICFAEGQLEAWM